MKFELKVNKPAKPKTLKFNKFISKEKVTKVEEELLKGMPSKIEAVLKEMFEDEDARCSYCGCSDVI